MHKHIVRLLTLVAIIAVVATTAKFSAIQDTFHQYGHYRGASVAQIAAKLPQHQGSASYQSCHKEIYAEWSSGIHRKAHKDNKVVGTVVKSGVNCEVCHNGPAGNHPSKEAMPLSTTIILAALEGKKFTKSGACGRNLFEWRKVFLKKTLR